MAKQIKKASLLSEADKQKLLKKAGNKKPLAQAQTIAPTVTTSRTVSPASARLGSQEQNPVSDGKNFRIWLAIAVVIAVAVIMAPKPQLLEYHSAGLSTQSIYMPGWFGQEGTILDTNQRAVLAKEEQTLYLCFEGQSKEQCAKYQLRQQQGFVAASIFWFSSRL